MTDYVFNKKYILFLCEVGDGVGKQLRNPTKKEGKKKNLGQMFPGEKTEVNPESKKYEYESILVSTPAKEHCSKRIETIKNLYNLYLFYC